MQFLLKLCQQELAGEVVMEILSKVGPIAVYRHHPLNWSAVFGGWLITTAVAWVLYTLGLAVGFSSIDVTLSDAAAKAWGVGTRVWLLLTWAGALFMGGLFTSWIDGKAHTGFGVLNGLAVWGLTTTIAVLLLSFGYFDMLQGGGSLLRARAEVIHGPSVAAALWQLFFSSVAGAFAAVAGGWVGAGHLHHVYAEPVARERAVETHV